ncbi:hypothetical protein QFZ36_001026 [Pseudarthrobacter siccitolerans]|uniref:DUF2142 domain-containing protein n=1 Tax=Pseudarthrobacter siccitolerans TaxID=861266 RepID=A0ABU0PHM4_9MICC|nr:DUF2142 domain-containing protein [Pseudarthrobacter siccitolerans]MDQ0673465.1 hypothetical protein [Pseudarthrobacter siccitolerans]
MRTSLLLRPAPSLQAVRVRPGQLRVLFLAWLLIGAAGTIWCFASPLMSIPDEPAHTVKAAAVARGQLSGTSSGIQGEPLSVQVPGFIAQLHRYSCFAQHSDITPACSPTIDASDRGWTTAKTSAGNYNPVYYGIVGIGSRGLSGEPALYAMRLISTWVTAFFLASVVSAASSLRRFQLPVIAVGVSLTPAVLFLAGSINPNAIEIGATAALFMNLCAIFEQSAGKIRIHTLNVATGALSGMLLANTRPLALVWLCLAALAALLCYGFPALLRALKDWRFVTALGSVFLSCLFALWWIVSAKSFDSLLAGPPMPGDQAALAMLDKSIGFMVEYVGVLGWLDTMPPAGTLYAWVLGFGVLLFLAFTARPVRARWVMLLMVIAVIAVPTVLQASSSEKLGWIWQGRYALAMVLTMLLAAGVAARFRPFRITPWRKSAIRWGVILGVLAHLYVFLEGLRRYTVGIHGLYINWGEMFEPQWQPPFSWQGLTVAYVLVLSVAGVCLYRLLTVRGTQAAA